MKQTQRLDELVEKAERITRDRRLYSFVLGQNQYKYTEDNYKFLFTAECFRDIDVLIPVRRKFGFPSGNIRLHSHICTDSYPSVGTPEKSCRVRLPVFYDYQDTVAKLGEFVIRYTANFEK
jgi:hypothetical protein